MPLRGHSATPGRGICSSFSSATPSPHSTRSPLGYTTNKRARLSDHRGLSNVRDEGPSISVEDEEAAHDREENDSLNETIMALDMKSRGTVGCCYYVAREEKLYFMEDVKLGGLNAIDARKSTRQPGI
jgi:DNA mismatch repair protein MSH5